MRKGKINYGRGLHDLFWETDEQNTQEKEEKRIKEQIKALKDERNTHNQRIKTIDGQLEKLEKELALLTQTNNHINDSEDDTDHLKLKHYAKDDLVLGESNLTAARVLESTMRNLGKQNNPLTLYGASGTGKTHFARAFTDEVRNADNSVIHLSAMEFIDQLVFALSNQTEDEFRNNLIDCDLLIIDDLQHFIGRFGCQDELCIILDQRIANGKQVILTSVEHPQQLDWHNGQLKSRLLSGLNLKLELADASMQIQMLRQRLVAEGIDISQELLSEAVKNTNGNGWLIEGVAKQIIDMAHQGHDITQDEVSKLL